MFLPLWTTARQFPPLAPTPFPGPANPSVPYGKAHSDLGKQFPGRAQLSGRPCTRTWPSSHFQVHAFHSQVPCCHLHLHVLSGDDTEQGEQDWSGAVTLKRKLPWSPAWGTTSKFLTGRRRRNVAFRSHMTSHHHAILWLLIICWPQLLGGKFLESEIIFC